MGASRREKKDKAGDVPGSEKDAVGGGGAINIVEEDARNVK